MSYWNIVYPDAAEPITHSKNEKITNTGLHFVTNVVFHSLGQNGVITINVVRNSYLLVYQTAFNKPFHMQNGGKVSFEGANCVQINVCSYEAYAKEIGEHSYVVLHSDIQGKNEIVECSIMKTIGKQCVLFPYYGILNFSNTNVSYCVGEDQAAWRFVNLAESSSPSQKFTTCCNISSTISWPVFGYNILTRFDVHDSIFIKNSNKLGNYGIFYVRHQILNFYRCIIVNNTGENLFHLYESATIKILDCFINNPKCPNNGKDYGSTTDPFDLNLSHFSTELCVVNIKYYQEQSDIYYSDYCISFIFSSTFDILFPSQFK